MNELRVFDAWLTTCALVVVTSSTFAAQPRLPATIALETHRGPMRELPAADAVEAYRRIPIGFESNVGQVDGEFDFFSRGLGYTLYLTSGGALLRFSSPTNEPRSLRMSLANARDHAEVHTADELPGRSHYFIGNDPDRWRSQVPRFGRVRYDDVYSGVDLVYHGNAGRLEYDFVVEPGADPSVIRLDFAGAQSIEVDGDGNLVLELDGGRLVQPKPVVFQGAGAERSTVAGSYVVDRDEPTRVGFRLGPYDSSAQLTIDPVLVYSTYLGEGGDDIGCGAAVDPAGNLYLAGWTDSVAFPTTAGAFGTAPIGETDAFVVKLNASGDTLLYSTYIGGADEEFEIVGLAIDGAGSVYITGSTKSTDYPVTAGALQTTHAGGEVDAVVTKLDPTGASLTYSTFLGGDGIEGGQSIVLDAAGNAFITGFTGSQNFPTTVGAFQESYIGGAEAFVAKLNASGASLDYCTYLGGSGHDMPTAGIDIDASGNAYVMGTTFSQDFPVTPGAIQGTLSGASDAYVVKLDASGGALVYSTFVGGTSQEEGRSVAVGTNGDVYVAGITASSDFPTTANAFQTTSGGQTDVFVTRITSSGDALIYSSYLGGAGPDLRRGFALDNLGNFFVSGATSSPDFPTTPGAVQSDYAGGEDAFVTKVSPDGSSIAYSTYLGGSGNDRSRNMAVDALGDAYVVGFTSSDDFPLAGALQSDFRGGVNDCFFAGGCDTFISKIGGIVPVRVHLTASVSEVAGGESLPFTMTLDNVSESPQGFGLALQLRLPNNQLLEVLPPQLTMLPPNHSVNIDVSLGPLPPAAPPGSWQIIGMILLPTPAGPEIQFVSALEFTVVE